MKNISRTEHYVVQFLNVHRKFENCLCGEARTHEEASKILKDKKRYLWNVQLRIIKIVTTTDVVEIWDPPSYEPPSEPF